MENLDTYNVYTCVHICIYMHVMSTSRKLLPVVRFHIYAHNTHMHILYYECLH